MEYSISTTTILSMKVYQWIFWSCSWKYFFNISMTSLSFISLFDHKVFHLVHFCPMISPFICRSSWSFVLNDSSPIHEQRSIQNHRFQCIVLVWIALQVTCIQHIKCWWMNHVEYWEFSIGCEDFLILYVLYCSYQWQEGNPLDFKTYRFQVLWTFFLTQGKWIELIE